MVMEHWFRAVECCWCLCLMICKCREGFQRRGGSYRRRRHDCDNNSQSPPSFMAINILTSIPNFQGAGRRREEIVVEAPEELPSGESTRLKAKDLQVPLNRRLG
jgi:hypothetical protein